jgi:hypothetical protein
MAPASPKLNVISADRAGATAETRRPGRMTALATCATLYGIAGSFSSPWAGSRSCARGLGTASIPFIAILTVGHAIWQAYGIGIANCR